MDPSKENIKETINTLVAICHTNATLKGFHDGEFNFGEKIALIHSELSEALETYRKEPNRPDDHIPSFTNVEVELADAVIRIFDLAGKLQYNLGSAMLAKIEYNATRPYKHNKNF